MRRKNKKWDWSLWLKCLEESEISAAAKPRLPRSPGCREALIEIVRDMPEATQ
jgi:hypothetical protein